MTERDSTEMEIYSGANERPDYSIIFPDNVTAEQIAEFEEHHVAAGSRHAPIDLSWVTTEPVYEGPKWIHVVKLVASITLMAMLCAIAVAVVVKA